MTVVELHKKNTTIVIPTYNEGIELSNSCKQKFSLIGKDIINIVKGDKIPFEHSYSNIYRTLGLITKETNIPIIIIDDGSTDDSINQVQLFKKNNPLYDISILSHQKNKGKGGALLTALEIIKTKYLFLTDADILSTGGLFKEINFNDNYNQFIFETNCIGPWGKEQFFKERISYLHSGTRIIKRDALIKFLNSDIEELLKKNKYGLETILNKINFNIKYYKNTIFMPSGKSGNMKEIISNIETTSKEIQSILLHKV